VNILKAKEKEVKTKQKPAKEELFGFLECNE
jgi:hypothetical protein